MGRMRSAAEIVAACSTLDAAPDTAGDVLAALAQFEQLGLLVDED
jgi:hypothetical protein